jgi:hypothetical protein
VGDLKISTERSGAAENRDLFIMTTLDPNADHSSGKSSDEIAKRDALLCARFAPWYYIISAESFAKIRKRRFCLCWRKILNPNRKLAAYAL